MLQIEPHVQFFHCTIHRQATAAKLEPEVHKVLQDVTDMVNFIKTRTLNSRVFTIAFNEMGSDHENHTSTLRFAGYLAAKWLKELSNLKMHYAGFFPQRQLFKIC